MKIRTKRELLQANSIFSDREEPRAVFWKNYERCKVNINMSGDIQVISYYGIGGIGKSTLLKKIMSEMDEKIRNPKYVYYDLSIKQDSRSVLESIKRILVRNYKFEFPLFEIGVYTYTRKIGGVASEPEIKALAEESPVLDLILSAAGMVPGMGIVSQVVACADKGIAIAKSLLGKHKKSILDMENQSPAEIYASLPYLFALDMSDNLENTTEPFVFFLDTYEMLVNEMISIGEPLENDKWIRGEEGLIQNIPNTLWVIAGREKLKWERFDSDWSDSLEQHILGELSKSDAMQFLKMTGVENEALRECLYDLTRGTPVYLDLCVDRYMKLKEEGKTPQIDDFGKDIYSLIERYARYMDDNRKEMMYILACLQVWDDEMVTSIAPKIFPAFTSNLYENVKKFSFITKTDTNHYKIHQTVGDVLRECCPDVMKDNIERAAMGYNKTNVESKNTLSGDYEYSLKRLVEGGVMNAKNSRQLLDFYMDNAIYESVGKLFELGKFEIGHQIIDSLVQKAMIEKRTTLYAMVAWDYSRWLMDEGKYEEALTFAEDAYVLHRDFFGEEEMVTVKALRNLATALSCLRRNEEALDMYKQVYEKMKILRGENHPDTLFELNNIASVAYSMGKYKEALALQQKVYQSSVEAYGEDHLDTLLAMTNLASGYAAAERYEEALELYKKVYAKRSQILGEDHPKTLRIMDNMGMMYEYLGEEETALKIYEEIFDKRRNILGKEHPDTQETMGRMVRLFDRRLKRELGME